MTQFNMGGEVPQSYYVCNSKPSPRDGMQSLEIGSRSKKKLEFDVQVIQSVLRYVYTVYSILVYPVLRKHSSWRL